MTLMTHFQLVIKISALSFLMSTSATLVYFKVFTSKIDGMLEPCFWQLWHSPVNALITEFLLVVWSSKAEIHWWSHLQVLIKISLGSKTKSCGCSENPPEIEILGHPPIVCVHNKAFWKYYWFSLNVCLCLFTKLSIELFTYIFDLLFIFKQMKIAISHIGLGQYAFVLIWFCHNTWVSIQFVLQIWFIAILQVLWFDISKYCDFNYYWIQLWSYLALLSWKYVKPVCLYFGLSTIFCFWLLSAHLGIALSPPALQKNK